MNKIFSGYTLISDFDGTMYSRKTGIPQINIDEKNRFEQLGGNFILATGRSVESARKFVSKIGCRYPCVLFNGAVIYDYHEEKFIESRFMSRDLTKDFIEDLYSKFPGVGVEVYCKSQHYMVYENEYAAEHAANEGFDYVRAGTGETPEEWIKVIISGDTDVIDRLCEYAQKSHPSNVRVTRSSGHFCEIIEVSVNKFLAASRLMSILGFPLDKSCGIGDYYNDIELFTQTAFGAVPAGSPPELLAIAPFVTCSCGQGAVADFIVHIETVIKSRSL